MECTFLLGKTPASKRKKPTSEVEVLEARLETIESKYSERLRTMETLLSKVMPTPGGQDATKEGSSISVSASGSGSGSSSMGPQGMMIDTYTNNDDGWQDINSPLEKPSPYIPNWDRTFDMAVDPSTPTLSAAMATPTIGTPLQKPIKEETMDTNIPLFTPEFQSSRSVKSPASSIAPSFTSTDHHHRPPDSDGDEEGDLGELAVTMDKMRLFDASVYFGKGSMLFTSTDQNQFWDEEISFDIHETHDVDIPQEALILPPVEVIDALFDIYYQHYYPFLPMIQKTTLLQALEDRFEPQSIFLLNSVFMASALTGDCKHPSCYTVPGDQKTLATPFFERARMVMDYCIGIPRLTTVQGLIMLSRYPRISGLGRSFVHQAVLMALDLGLHRKCDRWIPDKQVQEARKRIFWCVYGADSSSSSVTGRRPLIDDNEVDVGFPAPCDGEDETEALQSLWLLQMCKLWRIFRNIKRYIFNAAEVQDMVPGSLPKTYEQQLIQWQLQLPAVLRFNFDIKADDPRAMYNSRAGICQMLYESALILLHKPYISSSEHLKRSPYRSQDICIKAATKITDIGKVLAQSYNKVYSLTSAGEYAMLNAVRIHVMYIKSTDTKIAEQALSNFDYIMNFFREFYSSTQSNCDEQGINCVLSFFDEFMHTVKGLSQSTVHVCAGAIRSLAIAKRSRIPLGRRHGQHDHGNSGQTSSSSSGAGTGDQRNFSRLVKIGRQERAKARSASVTSPLPLPLRDAPTSLQRKRHSHMQHEGQQRMHPSQYIQQFQQQTQQRQGSIASTASVASGSLQGNDSGYFNPGKLQKVSQFIGPFGGPQVLDSLKQFQTATAILSQPQQASSSTGTPQTTNVLSTTGEMFQSFGQAPPQAMTLTLQQQQHQQQQQQQQAQFTMPQQQTQQLYNQIGQQIGLYDSFNPTFWGDMNTAAGSNTCFLNDNQVLNRDVLGNNANSTDIGATNDNNPTGTPGQSEPTLSQGTSTTDQATNTTGTSANASTSGFLNATLYDPNQNQFLSNVQDQQQQQQHSGTDTSGLYIPLKMEPNDGTSGLLDEELSADQVQALLEQTLAASASNARSNPNHNNAMFGGVGGMGGVGGGYYQNQNQFRQQLQMQQQQQQQQSQFHGLELTGVQEDYHTTSWGLM
ncbi:Transcriptional activator of fatty acid utilization [Podila clonocystis]|nr:Transcriptional activator of fatty acid utilization [Podila clonocystis]